MTANAFDEDRQRCLEAGMNDHIGKQVVPDKLYETLVRWLTRDSVDDDQRVTPLSESGDALPPGLRNIPGLDVQAGLSNVRGRVKTYLRALEIFTRNHGDVTNLIQQCLEVEDWEQATRHAHSLKGVAATLGSSLISEAARDLESALKEQADTNELKPMLETMDKRLAPVVKAIQTTLRTDSRVTEHAHRRTH